MTYEEIEELAGHRQVPSWVVKLVSDAVAIEREACAKVCEEAHWSLDDRNEYAAAIRARGQE
jgi:hypothetical protein